jgi:hypothetical protein
MATIEQLSTALINADKAGDVEAARALAAEIRRMQAVEQPQQQAADPNAPDTEDWTRGTILPIKTKKGQIEFGMPTMLSGILQSAGEAISAPYRAMTGELPMTDASGRTSPQAIAEAANMALLTSPNSVAQGTLPAISRLAAQKQLAKDVISPKNQLLEAGQRIGVDIPKAVASDSKIVQSASKALENQPIFGSPLIRASEKAKTQLDDAAKGVQDAYGIGNPHGAGTEVKDSALEYSKVRLAAREENRYKPAEAMITKNVITPLDKTGEVMLDIMARRDNAALPPGSAAKMVWDGVFKTHGDTPKGLNMPVKPGESVESVFNLKRGMNYQGIKDLRGYVRETLDDPMKLSNSGMSQKDLTRIYSALTADLRASVVNAGKPGALTEWEKANAFSARANQEREYLQKIVGAKEPEAIVDSIIASASTSSRASLNKLFQVRKAVDKETWDEVASAAISKMGRDTGGEFSWDRFVTARNKLTPTGKAVLFNTTGKKGLSKSLDDIEAVSRRFSEINKKYGNPSGTARVGGYLAVGGTFIAAPISTTSTVIGGNLVSMYLASPAKAKMLSDYAKAYENAVLLPSASTQNNLLKKARVLAIMAANDLGSPAMADGFVAKLGTVQKGATDSQKSGSLGTPIGNPQADQPSQQFNDAYLQGQAL